MNFYRVGASNAVGVLMDIHQLYKQKLMSTEDAVRVVKSGDWVDYGWAVTAPVALDLALSKRIQELDDIKLRGGILVQIPEVFKVDTQGKHVSWHTWHALKCEALGPKLKYPWLSIGATWSIATFGLVFVSL